MKNILLFTLLASASLHAIEPNVEIVPFDKEKHHATVSALLQEKFKPSLDIATEDDPFITPEDNVSVLVPKNRSTGSTHPAETILGCISYSNTYPSQPSAPKITTIKYLVVAKEHRGKGYGKHLLQHVQDYARKNNMDKIVGTSTRRSIDFYRKLGARPTDYKNPLAFGINLSQPNNHSTKEDQVSDLDAKQLKLEYST